MSSAPEGPRGDENDRKALPPPVKASTGGLHGRPPRGGLHGRPPRGADLVEIAEKEERFAEKLQIFIAIVGDFPQMS